MRETLVRIVLDAEHDAHGVFNPGDLLGSGIATARYHQHEDRCGIARIVDGAQGRGLLLLARLRPQRVLLAARGLWRKWSTPPMRTNQ